MVVMHSPGLLAGNPPPRWGAPGDDLAVAEVAMASAGVPLVDPPIRRRAGGVPQDLVELLCPSPTPYP